MWTRGEMNKSRLFSVYLFFLVALTVLATGYGVEYNYEDLGAVGNTGNPDVAIKNGHIMNVTLNKLLPGDVFIVPEGKTYTLLGGILVEKELKEVKIQIDGTLSFTNDRDNWPLNKDGHVMECMDFRKITKSLITSKFQHGKGGGVIDGKGKKWWGAIQYLKNQEDRPRLIHIREVTETIVENIYLKDSPFWTFYAERSDGLTIRYVDVDARWDQANSHTLLDLQAFNTDGFDVTGKNVYIHDCTIWNQDDCIAVKEPASNMLFERISCSGVGLTIGSVGESVVSNITFRDSVLPNTYKGIYIKNRWDDRGAAPLDVASITNILYENITMTAPEQYAIWIGPAQQTGQPCDLDWPYVPKSQCKMTGFQTFANITLKDITIIDPQETPAVIIGNDTNPIQNLVFDNVKVQYTSKYKKTMSHVLKPWGNKYNVNNNVKECKRKGIDGYYLNGCDPVPACFKETSEPPYDPSIIPNLK